MGPKFGGLKHAEDRNMVRNARGTTIGETAVLEWTGKTLDEWFRLVDAWGGRDKPHKQIAAYVRTQQGASPWWSQEITVLYEKHINRRVTGQTSSGLFQIEAGKTLPVGLDRAWEMVTGKDTVRAIVGEGCGGRFSDGAAGVSSSGTRYNVRVFKPRSHIRMGWAMKGWEKDSTLQIRVTPRNQNATAVSFHQENLQTSGIRDRMRLRWKEVLEQLASKARIPQG
jgi:hypothetical protein